MRKNSVNIFIITTIILLTSLIFSSCSEKEKVNSKKVVALSTYVLYDITSFIAEDTLELMKVIPSGVDIHSYEPSPRIMARIYSSDLFLLNGVVLEPWLHSFEFKNRVLAMDSFLKLSDLNENHKEHSHSGACSHGSHGSYDPHIWFDIDKMKHMTEVISDELINLEPKHKKLYIANRDKYIDRLDKIDAQYKEKLQMCKRNTIITDHNAFSYLAQNYKFEIKTLSGFSPDVEASPKDMIRVINEIKKHDVPIIFFENFGSDKAMKNIAEQTNIQILSLHPLGNITKDDVKYNRNYEDIMLENLEKISKALECQ